MQPQVCKPYILNKTLVVKSEQCLFPLLFHHMIKSHKPKTHKFFFKAIFSIASRSILQIWQILQDRQSFLHLLTFINSLFGMGSFHTQLIEHTPQISHYHHKNHIIIHFLQCTQHLITCFTYYVQPITGHTCPKT